MHESGVTQEMLRVVLEEATKARISKITHINIALGELSHMTPESVQSHFQEFSKGTPAEGAILAFRSVEGNVDFCIETMEGDR